MRDELEMPRRLFTIDEANAMLPLVRAITTDLAALARDLSDRQRRFAGLRGQRPARGDVVYREEVEQAEAALAKDFERLKEYVAELTALGVEPKGADEGLVDFPTLIDGRPAYLCWKLGEPEVGHWHSVDAGFAGRQPLTAGSVAGSDHEGAEGLEDDEA